MSDSHTYFERTAPALWTAAAVLAIALATPASGSAQQEPALNIHSPFISFVVDTSGSMNWTYEGDENYPEDTDQDLPDCRHEYDTSKVAYNKYKPICRWGVQDGSGDDEAPDDASQPGTPFSDENPGPRRFGPCYVWEPSCGGSSRCQDASCPSNWSQTQVDCDADPAQEYRCTPPDRYERPPNKVTVCASDSDCPTDWTCVHTDNNIGYCEGNVGNNPGGRTIPVRDPDMKARLDLMIESDNRLESIDLPPSDAYHNENAVRQVQAKEILAGTKSLGRSTKPGPGCWIVPRNPAEGAPDCGSGGNYDSYPDWRSGMPLIQPVWSEQKEDGLLDSFSSYVFLSVGTMDSYKDPQTGNMEPSEADAVRTTTETADWFWEVDDRVTGAFDSGAVLSTRESPANSPYPYNLGMSQLLMPKYLPGSEASRKNLGHLGQQIVNSTGYLRDYECRVDSDCPIGRCDVAEGRCIPSGYSTMNTALGTSCNQDTDCTTPGADCAPSGECVINSTATKFYLGKQPVAGATPMAAMFYDMQHHWNKKSFDIDEAVEPGNPTTYDDYSPVVDDTFQHCRPNHTVLLTDGLPAPENDPWCTAVDAGLVSSYGYPEMDNKNYDPWEPKGPDGQNDTSDDHYMHKSTEEAISVMCSDQDLTSDLSGKGYLYDPRVHVVSMGVDHEEVKEATVYHKLIRMAKQGETCAGYYLPELVPESNSPLCDDSNPELECDGCDPDSEVCLDPLQGQVFDDNNFNYQYQPPVERNGTPASTVECRYPALILKTNQSSTSVSDEMNMPKLSFLLRHIIWGAGVDARSKPGFVNQLDEPAFAASGKHGGGQFRFFPGVSVNTQSTYWKGLLFRQIRKCKVQNGNPIVEGESKADYIALHDRMRNLLCSHTPDNSSFVDGSCVNSTTIDDKDRRRVFTSVPTNAAFSYSDWRAKGQSGQNRFIFDYELTAEPNSNGEFGSTYLDVANNPSELVDRRIPVSMSTFFGEPGGASNQVEGTYNNTGASQCVLEYIEDGQYPPIGACSSGPISDQLTDETLYKTLRAQTDNRKNRPLGGIFQASPVGVGPPSMDLPIDSYRQYKDRHRNRLGMLYLNTSDGLLHALHSGGVAPDNLSSTEKSNMDEKQVKVRERTSLTNVGNGTTTNGSVYEQREAWAYLPQMLHVRMDEAFGDRTYFDPDLNRGTPVVKDVRLCHDNPDHNYNQQACDVVTSNTNSSIPPALQWRTVLLSGMGSTGYGYFALDVTRPGGKLQGTTTPAPPDPVPLWEMDAHYEQGQVEHLIDNGESDLVAPASQTSVSGSCADWDEFINQPLMGKTVGQPAIGTTVINKSFSAGNSPTRLRRPVAVFTGGKGVSSETNVGEFIRDKMCDPNMSGDAVYVVDVQTGTILRRFMQFNDTKFTTPTSDDTKEYFDADIVGSANIHPSQPGSVSTRAFVGDEKGRLYRLDMSEPDPSNWTLDLFFDPSTTVSGEGYTGPTTSSSPNIRFKPITTQGPQRNLWVIYGVQDASSRETRVYALVDDTDQPTHDRFQWQVQLENTPSSDSVQKLTSQPIAFNNRVYFASWLQSEGQQSPTDPKASTACKLQPFIWGLKLTNGDPAFSQSACNPSGNTCPSNSGKVPWFSPPGTEPVRGLRISFGPQCSVDFGSGTPYEGAEQQDAKLVAVTSPDTGSGGSTSSTASDTAGESVTKIEQPAMSQPSMMLKPFSWSVIKN